MYEKQPVKINLPNKFKRINCGVDFSTALTDDGSLFVWGNNKSSTLGVTNDNKVSSDVLWSPVPVTALGDKKVTHLACGRTHIMVITVEKNLFTWGNGARGKLGHGKYLKRRRKFN